MAKSSKTNVARLLDKAAISYELMLYDVNESDLTATHVAQQLGQDIRQVFKTLILKGDRNGYFVCVIPGDCEINLKSAAKLSANKNADLIPMKDLLSVTGYVRGGCSPIGMKKMLPTYFHASCLDFDFIYISAGVRGLQIKASPTTLVDYVKGVTADLL